MIALTIYTPVYFEVVLGQSASGAGLTLIPFMGGVVIGSTFGGKMMSRLKHYKRVGLGGLPLAVLALIPLIAFTAQLSIVVGDIYLGPHGPGIGIFRFRAPGDFGLEPPAGPLGKVAAQRYRGRWMLDDVQDLREAQRVL